MNAAGIREGVVSALTGRTSADDRVYSPRDWPTSADVYPVLLVQTPLEEKQSLGRNAPQFNTVTTVRITGRLEAMDDADNRGAMMAEVALEQLRQQVEEAVINADPLTRQIQQYKSVRSVIDISAAGEGHIGQLVMELEIEYYQGPADFSPLSPVPLADIRTVIRRPVGTTEPVVDVQFTSSSSR